jgi:hypothetical protein
LQAVNAAALPGASSLRSHAFSKAELQAVENGSLDVVTGFQVVDVDPAANRGRRLWVLEGLTGPNRGIERVRDAVGRNRGNSADFKLLAHSDVLFQRRAYVAFGAYPRTLRLREPLSSVLATPTTYNRQHVSASLHVTLTRLSDLELSHTLLAAKQLGLFPTTAGLLELESKLGGPVSLPDVYGADHPAAHTHQINLQALAATQRVVASHTAAAVDPSLTLVSTLRRLAVSAKQWH